MKKESYTKKAVALNYRETNDSPPKVTASGKGYVAENIIQKAMEHNVPVTEDQGLAELLSELTINETIPEELYQAVAEVFAFIYKANQRI